MEQKDILKLIPQDIRVHLYSKGENAQVKAFQELFVLLGRSAAVDGLRRKVWGFFSATSALKPHLKSTPGRSCFCNVARLDLPAYQSLERKE